MKRWDGLVDECLKVCEARGLGQEYLENTRHELDRRGCWLKRRKPRPRLEEIDGQSIIACLRGRTRFRSKATVAGVASKLRCMGEFAIHREFRRSEPSRFARFS
jgi:hypothetical protein